MDMKQQAFDAFSLYFPQIYKTSTSFSVFWENISTIVFPSDVIKLPFIKYNVNILSDTSEISKNILKQQENLIDWKKMIILEKSRLFFENTCETSCAYPYIFKIDPLEIVDSLKLTQIRTSVFVGKWDALLNYFLLQKKKNVNIKYILLCISKYIPIFEKLPRHILSSNSFTMLQIQRFIYKRFCGIPREKLSNIDANNIINNFIGVPVYFIPFQDLRFIGVKSKVELLQRLYIEIFVDILVDKNFEKTFKKQVEKMIIFVKATKVYQIIEKINHCKSFSDQEILNIITVEHKTDPIYPKLANVILKYEHDDNLDNMLTQVISDNSKDFGYI
jgi:hypothetical protein